MKLALLLAIFLFGCSQKQSWTVSYVPTAAPSSRLSYISKDKLNGIDIVFMEAEEQLHCHLQVHAKAIERTTVTLKTEEGEESFLAACHEGGHRLTLPQEFQQRIMELLKEKKTFILIVDAYRERIDPGSFETLDIFHTYSL